MEIKKETIAKALLSCKGHSQGAKVVLVIGSRLHAEMRKRGLVTAAGNLTRAGSIAAERAKLEHLESMIEL